MYRSWYFFGLCVCDTGYYEWLGKRTNLTLVKINLHKEMQNGLFMLSREPSVFRTLAISVIISLVISYYCEKHRMIYTRRSLGMVK
jgi:ABC-type lipopolysaccharide export system ATPase subunit